MGAAFATINSPAQDRLLGAETPVAARAELHTMTMDGTVLPAGQSFPLTRRFEHAPAQTVTVEPIGARQ